MVQGLFAYCLGDSDPVKNKRHDDDAGGATPSPSLFGSSEGRFWIFGGENLRVGGERSFLDFRSVTCMGATAEGRHSLDARAPDEYGGGVAQGRGDRQGC